MDSNTSSAVILVESQEDNGVENSSIVDVYKKLGETCDLVMDKIKSRKSRKSNKNAG